MKKILKKFLIGAIVVLSTTTIYSKSISIKGITEILKIVTKIYTQQQLMGTEQIQQGMSLITQIENQVRQIENQYTMLKRFSDELAQGNLTHLEDYYREFGYMLDSYDSIMLDTENLSKRYVELFKEKPKEFEKIGITQDYMEKMDKNIREARQESNTALYDVMVSKGFAAKIGADEQNLKMLLEASKSSTGVVETLQITNSLLGQISANISQLGLLSETANKAQAMATNTESQEMESSKQELEEIGSRQELKENEKLQELINKSKKEHKNMIIAKIIAALYVFYFLEKTESLKKLKDTEKYFIYFFLAILTFSNTQINVFNLSFDFLIIGIIVVLFEILLKYLKITTQYLFLKIYAVILLVLLLFRGGLWILQLL